MKESKYTVFALCICIIAVLLSGCATTQQETKRPQWQSIAEERFSLQVPDTFSIKELGGEDGQLLSFCVDEELVGGINSVEIPNIDAVFDQLGKAELEVEEVFASILLQYGKGYQGHNFSNGKEADLILFSYFENCNIEHRLYLEEGDWLLDLWLNDDKVEAVTIEAIEASFVVVQKENKSAQETQG